MSKTTAIGYLALLVFLCVLVSLGKYSPDTTFTTSPSPLSIIVASTSAEQELGLGKRASLPQDEGMLFVFDRPDVYAFWMKDMQFPIDMIFLDENFRIVTIDTNVSPNTYPKSFLPASPNLYVLETNAFVSQKNNWKVGDQLLFLKKAVNKS